MLFVTSFRKPFFCSFIRNADSSISSPCKMLSLTYSRLNSISSSASRRLYSKCSNWTRDFVDMIWVLHDRFLNSFYNPRGDCWWVLITFKLLRVLIWSGIIAPVMFLLHLAMKGIILSSLKSFITFWAILAFIITLISCVQSIVIHSIHSAKLEFAFFSSSSYCFSFDEILLLKFNPNFIYP